MTKNEIILEITTYSLSPVQLVPQHLMEEDAASTMKTPPTPVVRQLSRLWMGGVVEHLEVGQVIEYLTFSLILVGVSCIGLDRYPLCFPF